MGILQQLLGRWVGGVPEHVAPPSGPGAPVQPGVDSDTGNLLVGTDQYPVLDSPPFTLFDKPKMYVYRLVETAAAVIPGFGNRGMFFRCILNPPTNTTERSWGMQGSAETLKGCTADVSCGVPGHPDLMGVEGAARHGGSGFVRLIAGLMGYTMTEAGRVSEAISIHGLQAACSAGAQVDKAVLLRGWARATPGTIVKTFGIILDDALGNNGIGYDDPEAKLAVKGGVSAGRNEDPGDGVVHAEAGFKTRDGAVTRAGVSGTFTTTDGKTITVVNGIVTGVV